MILTCPACDTKYVVKDGAIPPAGRQVRCAACKTAWHQDPDSLDAEDDDALASSGPSSGRSYQIPAESSLGGPPMPGESADPQTIGDVPPLAADEAMVSDYPEPDVGADDLPSSQTPPEPVWPATKARFAPLTAGRSYGLTAPSLPAATPPIAEAPAAPRSPEPLSPEPPPPEPLGHDPAPEAWDEEHHFISAIDDHEERGGRGLKIALGLLLLVAAAAAALWFLAPASFKERIGLADASATPLEVMLTTSDRQKLASGNELLAISGRVINPTDAEQAIPPIRASLRNRATRKLVYQWTIAPPARSLPPRGSASFNSAEVDIPQGGDELTVTLGGAAS